MSIEVTSEQLSLADQFSPENFPKTEIEFCCLRDSFANFVDNSSGVQTYVKGDLKIAHIVTDDGIRIFCKEDKDHSGAELIPEISSDVRSLWIKDHDFDYMIEQERDWILFSIVGDSPEYSQERVWLNVWDHEKSEIAMRVLSSFKKVLSGHNFLDDLKGIVSKKVNWIFLFDRVESK